jgi:hypothetical protein
LRWHPSPTRNSNYNSVMQAKPAFPWRKLIHSNCWRGRTRGTDENRTWLVWRKSPQCAGWHGGAAVRHWTRAARDCTKSPLLTLP